MLNIVAVAVTFTVFATIVISVVRMCNYVKGGKTKSMPQILVRPIFCRSPSLMQPGNVA